jgi:hypothetical protein
MMLSPPCQAAGTAMAGKVVSVDGKVLIRQDGSSGGGFMKPGIEVKEGDVINTASDGKAKILLQDKTILDIGPSALFKVEKFRPNHGGDRNVDLSMPYGTTRVSVSQPIASKGKFQIRTKTATMGVRGTEFVVQAEIPATLHAPAKQDGGGEGGAKAAPAKAPETKITVIQGKVAVDQPATRQPAASGGGEKPKPQVMLTAGTQLTASVDAPAAKPVKLEAAQLSQISAATTVSDNTFSNAVSMDLKSDSGGGGGNSKGPGGGGDSGAGAATRAAIGEAIVAQQQSQPTFVPPAGPMIGPVVPVFQSPAVIPIGGFRNLHIVVTK